MFTIIQLFLQILIGILLLWFGYTLFFTFIVPKNRAPQRAPTGKAGDPRTCPVCGIKLLMGERVKSSVYPSLGTKDRIMHIYGCPYCLSGERERYCPVCRQKLLPSEHLIARMFDRPGRSHVHVLGCTRCRRG